MTYNRNEGRRPNREYGRDPRNRFADDRDERGFFERAGDEVASWFSDDDAEQRRRMDPRMDDDDGRRPRRALGDDSRFDRDARFRDEGYRRPYTGRAGSRGGSGDDYRDDRGIGRPAGSQREFTGAAAGAHDPHYSEWRNRQIDALDRDYDDYRRENQSRFEDDFANWRTTRQTKRQMLGQVREHMQVLGSDEQPVGTVDNIRGDQVILTKNDSADGQHHSLNCSLVDRIEGDRVILSKPAEEAIKTLSNNMRDRALFERDEDREPGAHILNRSFSGTY
ncbi:MAG: DUF2171 domain-containing protein [Sphingomicrobium sp.]